MCQSQDVSQIEGGEIEHFQYLVSHHCCKWFDRHSDRQAHSQCFQTFGALRQAVFKDNTLTIITKRAFNRACVLLVLLYDGECWTLMRRHLKELDSFHHRCICSVLGITNRQQWDEHISSEKV